MIRHMVCSGAGPNGLVQMGVIQEYIREGLLDVQKIDKFYGCSAGAMIGFMLLLNIPLDEPVEYIIGRPWYKFAKIDLTVIHDKGGMFECEKVKEMLEPLLLAHDIPFDITFRQASQNSAIDLHVFATDVDTFESVDFCLENTPDMPLTTAIMLSSAIPPFFCAGAYQGKTYIDGGFSTNFPLSALMESKCKPDPATVLCINMVSPKEVFLHEWNLMQRFMYILIKVVNQIGKYELNKGYGERLCDHYVPFQGCNIFSTEIWTTFLYSAEGRRASYESGVQLGRESISRWRAKANVVE